MSTIMQVSTNGAFGCGLFYPDLHMSEHVSECISAGITSSASIESSLQSLFEADIAPTPLPLLAAPQLLLLTPFQFLLFHQYPDLLLLIFLILQNLCLIPIGLSARI